MAQEGPECSRSPEQRIPRWGRWRSTRARRWSRRRSHPVLIPWNTGIDALEEATHPLDGPDRNEFDAIAIDHYLDPLPGDQAELLPDILRNYHLKLGRDSHRGHGAPPSIGVSYYTYPIDRQIGCQAPSRPSSSCRARPRSSNPRSSATARP